MERKALVEAGELIRAKVSRGRNTFPKRDVDPSFQVRGRRLPQEKWQRILLNVGEELKHLEPSGLVKPLYDGVMMHLGEAIPHILGRRVDSEWKDMRQYWTNSRNFFIFIRGIFSISYVKGRPSLYSLFDALVRGLTFDDGEWMAQRSLKDRDEYLAEILERIGSELQAIDKGGFYDKMIGQGTSSVMKSVYNILQDRKSGIDSDDFESGPSKRDWRERLLAVMKTVDRMKPVFGTEWVFNSVRKSMHASVKKMNAVDIENPKVWGKILTLLNKHLSNFELLGGFPGGTGVVFSALYDALEKELSKTDEWLSIEGEENRNNKINSILSGLGEGLEKVDPEAFTGILGKTGPELMQMVAEILADKT